MPARNNNATMWLGVSTLTIEHSIQTRKSNQSANPRGTRTPPLLRR